MGNVCGNNKSAVCESSPAVPGDDSEKNQNGIQRIPQSGTGTVHAEAVIQEIQRASTPMPPQEEDNYQIIRLLLLGAAESGKTTLLEQIRLLNKQNFSEAELFHRKAFIYNNIMSSIRTLITRSRQMGMKYTNGENETNAELILSQDETQYGHFTPDIEKAICSVWADPTTQQVYAKRSEINLNDSTKYFLDSCEKINKIDFRPTSQDLIMSYIPTVGVQNIIFTTNNRSFQLFDIGGQRIDRRKWATMYDGIDAIFFCLAVSEYDQLMDEDGVTNRLTDSLSLLEKISMEPKFKFTPIFLFLNEIDVFKEKLDVFPLKNYLPEYNGSGYDDALNYIERIAMERLACHGDDITHVFRTICTDTDMMGKILGRVFRILLKKS